MICTAHQILLRYQIKEDKTGRACGTRNERNIKEYWLVQPTGLRSLGELCRIRLMWVSNKKDG
jgi:hypothetical protein